MLIPANWQCWQEDNIVNIDIIYFLYVYMFLDIRYLHVFEKDPLWKVVEKMIGGSCTTNKKHFIVIW